MTVIEAPVVQDISNDGDHDIFTHAVAPASTVTEAYITGGSVTAVCGKVWVPSRNPDRHQVCPECKDIMKKLGYDI